MELNTLVLGLGITDRDCIKARQYVRARRPSNLFLQVPGSYINNPDIAPRNMRTFIRSMKEEGKKTIRRELNPMGWLLLPSRIIDSAPNTDVKTRIDDIVTVAALDKQAKDLADFTATVPDRQFNLAIVEARYSMAFYLSAQEHARDENNMTTSSMGLKNQEPGTPEEHYFKNLFMLYAGLSDPKIITKDYLRRSHIKVFSKAGFSDPENIKYNTEKVITDHNSYRNYLDATQSLASELKPRPEDFRDVSSNELAWLTVLRHITLS